MSASADDPVPVTTGTALGKLHETPPAAPSGFESTENALGAIFGGSVPGANLYPPIPQDIQLQTNIEFGRADERPLSLDFSSPKVGSEPVPGVILIHGGGWRSDSRNDYRYYAVALADDPVSVITGTALEALGDTPPEPPAGFASSDEAMQAVNTGQVPLVVVFGPIPPGVEIKRDVEYGRAGNRPLLLDLYLPKNVDGAVPGLVFIHGGGWKSGGKEDYRFYGLRFAEKGYVVASIQYRLSREAQYPAAVHDVKAAVRWMRSEAESVGVDPQHIGVAGGSAGGHLSMMVAYSSDVPELDGDSGHPGVSSRVQCIVDLYGPTDLTTQFSRTRSVEDSSLSRFFDGTYGEQKQNYEAASPIRYVTSDDPPTLILHGTIDEIVPIEQADLLARCLHEAGVPYLYDRLPGWPHAMDLALSVNERCVWLMERFFDRYLRQGVAEQ